MGDSDFMFLALGSSFSASVWFSIHTGWRTFFRRERNRPRRDLDWVHIELQGTALRFYKVEESHGTLEKILAEGKLKDRGRRWKSVRS